MGYASVPGFATCSPSHHPGTYRQALRVAAYSIAYFRGFQMPRPTTAQPIRQDCAAGITTPVKHCKCCAIVGVELARQGHNTDRAVLRTNWRDPFEFAASAHLCKRNERLIGCECWLLKALAPVDGEAGTGYLYPGVDTLHQRQLPRGHLRQQHLHQA